MEEGYPHEAALELAWIRTDGGTQTRASLDYETVLAYAADMQAGDQFPPIEVYYDGTTYWLADGFHRLEATRENGEKLIIAKVYQGTQREAVLASASANARHGLRRTNQDKRRAVVRLLTDTEWGQWSDREIARRCHVSHPFVAKIREEEAPHTGSVSSGERVFIHKNGAVTWMNVERIGSGVGEKEYILAPEPLPDVRIVEVDSQTKKRAVDYRDRIKVVEATGNVTSDQQEPAYVAIWELERGVRDYLDWNSRALNKELSLDDKTLILVDGLDGLLTSGFLAKPWRKSDVRQAVNNILDQLRQAEKRKAEKQISLTAIQVGLLCYSRIDELAQSLGLDPGGVVEKAVEHLYYTMESGSGEETALPTL